MLPALLSFSVASSFHAASPSARRCTRSSKGFCDTPLNPCYIGPLLSSLVSGHPASSARGTPVRVSVIAAPSRLFLPVLSFHSLVFDSLSILFFYCISRPLLGFWLRRIFSFGLTCVRYVRNKLRGEFGNLEVCKLLGISGDSWVFGRSDSRVRKFQYL